MSTKAETATYTHGHSDAVLKAHSWRTAANSAGYLLPHLKPGMKVLDIGCGGGTITVDLVRYIASEGGHITGLDTTDAVLDQARILAKEKGLDDDVISFVRGDANTLTYADDTFDVVLCHQVLQHVRDPVGILTEMRRVAKGGGRGIVAAREADFGGFFWYPASPSLTAWRSLYCQITRHNGGEPDAGRMLRAWARKAGGFANDAEYPEENWWHGVSSWCFSRRADVQLWSATWASRIAGSDSSLAKTAVEAGLASLEELEKLAEGWRQWAESEDAWFSVPNAEIICRKA